MSVDIDSAYFPAAGNNIWWGAFKISDTGGFYGGLRAQPPHSITRIDYEFLKAAMPIVLEVDLHPEDLLLDNRCPNLRCAVLYFFPCETDDRSTENYSRLFKLLDTEKSVMISYIGEMELLIFTSKQLHPDHREVAERSIREEFLWGIIRPQVFSCSSSSCSSSSTDMEDKEGSNVDGDHGQNRTNNGQVTGDEESCGEISKRCEEEEPKANLIDISDCDEPSKAFLT